MKYIKLAPTKIFKEKWRDFNVFSNEIRNLQGVNNETYKRRPEKWPKPVLDEPRIDSYGTCGKRKHHYCEISKRNSERYMLVLPHGKTFL